MTPTSLKASTAMLIALSLMQPFPALAQSRPGVNAEEQTMPGRGNRQARTDRQASEAICAEAGILDPLACELHLQEIESDLDAVAQADAASSVQEDADAEAQARIDAEAQARADAEAQAQADAEAQAQADAEAAADAAAQEEADAEAQTQADAEAQAQAQAQADAEAAADAAAQEEADAEAQTQADAEAQAQAQAEVEAQAQADADAAAQEDADAAAQDDAETEAPRQRRADATEECLAEVVGSDGTILCIDEDNSAGIAAIAAGTDPATESEAEVTTETVTERSRRSSREEFREWRREARGTDGSADPDTSPATPGQPDSRSSDLERAGLFVLGALAVGAILSGGQRVESNSGDRVIVIDDDGYYRVLKDDDALLRQPGSEVRTERFSDGSTRTTVTRDDGTRIVTIRDSSGRALRRVRVDPDGREYLLIDDTVPFEPVDVRQLPRPVTQDFDYRAATDRESLRQALLAADRQDIGRNFSLRQVREYLEVRELAPEINLESITFATNSAAIAPSQAEQLRQMGTLMRDLIADDPTELFLIEGHTDAVGSAGSNLLLSDRRAESVALAFAEYFGVPAENMVVQGYGESFLKIDTQNAERLNRRVAVRRITALVRPL